VHKKLEKEIAPIQIVITAKGKEEMWALRFEQPTPPAFRSANQQLQTDEHHRLLQVFSHTRGLRAYFVFIMFDYLVSDATFSARCRYLDF